jgi:hypothetical protein
LGESYVNLSQQLADTKIHPNAKEGLPTLDEHQLYFFGLSCDAAELSFQAEKELKIRDLIDSG